MGGTEQHYVTEAFRSNWLSTVGPNLDAFERSIESHLGSNIHALAVSSGTAALHLILRAIGVTAGDVVAVSTLTFAASAWPILYLGATPAFIDSERASGNIDPGLVAEYFESSQKAGQLPRALVIVHLYGQHADIDPIAELCTRYGVTLVEDAAESLGATYRGRATGTTADYSLLSFNGNKMITTTGGGMVLAKRPADLERIRKWANQSREPAIEYLHREVGYNYRMSNVLAGIGRGQLECLGDHVSARRRVAARYSDMLSGLDELTLQPEAEWGTHSRWLTVMYLRPQYGLTPMHLISALNAENIESRPVWRPMHTQPVFEQAIVIGGSVSEDLFARGICLPSSSSLTEDEQARVCEVIHREVVARRADRITAQ